MTNYELLDKAVLVNKDLVITDLHIGYEEVMIDSGVGIPKTQFEKIKKNLEEIFKKTGKLDEIIILGDLKHEFGTINRQEWMEVLDIIDFLKLNCNKLVLIKGNHDKILEPLALKKDLEIKDYYIKNENAFLHGDRNFLEINDKRIKRIFLGHLHPAVVLQEGVKKEIYKCFLIGKWKSKEVIILPSFFPLIEGSDVMYDKGHLDFKLNLGSFYVFIPTPEKVLEFGKLKDVGRLS